MTTSYYLETWGEARTRFSNLLLQLKQEDLTKKLSGTKNSVGFLIRHIGDVELLFAKNVFNCLDLKVHAQTVIDQKDTGRWTNLEELLSYQKMSGDALKNSITLQQDQDWSKTITTKEFGTKTQAEALGRIISHTAYHAGQLALCLKYGA